MDVVVKSHHTRVPDSFRAYVTDKINRLEKLDGRVIRVEVEVSEERNPRQADHACRVEITVRTKGPAVRAEASAEEQPAAFDVAIDRLMAQLRRAADRKKVHRGSRSPRSLSAAAAQEAAPPLPDVTPEADADPATHLVAGMEVEGDGPLVVREKVHEAVPMTLDQALHAMELVGHDFYLFIDAEHQAPSVVYRRRAYDYGVIRLSGPASAPAAVSPGH